MPSFALHPINRITRSISSPHALPPPPRTKLVSVVSPSSARSHTSNRRSSRNRRSSVTSSTSSSHSSVHDLAPHFADMPRLNPLQLLSSITSASPTLHHSESYKPPSPVSSSSTSSENDSVPTPPSFPRSVSHHVSSSTRNHQFTACHHENPSRLPTDLPPVSPMSSMYDPHSAHHSPQSSTRLSDEDSAISAHSLDGNLFLRPRSTHENALNPSHLHRPVVTHAPPTRPPSRDVAPPVAFRRAFFEPPTPDPVHPHTHRESAFAGIAARGKAVDAFVANRHISDQYPNSHERAQPRIAMPRVLSGKSLEMPRGRLEQLPPPRPATPLQAPRPETPSRLPRPRVFINPSPSRHSVVDPVAVTHDTDMRYGEAEFITREIPRPVVPSPAVLAHNREIHDSSAKTPDYKDDFYFSDEEQVDDDVSVQLDQYNNNTATPSHMLQYKVRRAVSALRSISFQSHNPDDIESAWGQANVPDPVRERNNGSAVSNRWRRARGRISSKNGVQEYECRSEADAHSLSSYHSTTSGQRDRGTSSREQLRNVIGVPLRGDHGSRQRRSLWTGGKRDRQMAPQTRAAELLLSNGHGLLAASADAYGQSSALTAVPPMQVADVYDRNGMKRGSVDKYVEFVHASARSEARSKNQYRTLKSRIVNKVFRRRWS